MAEDKKKKTLEDRASRLTRKSTRMTKGEQELKDQAFREASDKAQEAGKGRVGQFRAGMKGSKEKEEQIQIAKHGTTRKYANVLGMLGIETGDFFNKYVDKKATKEQIKKARADLGLEDIEETLDSMREEMSQYFESEEGSGGAKKETSPSDVLDYIKEKEKQKHDQEIKDQAFREASDKAQAEGKGRVGQFMAGMKGSREKEEQLQIARYGTTKKYSNILRMLGVETGSFFNKYIEKKATKEEKEAAMKGLGLDKEESKAQEKPAKKPAKKAEVAQPSETFKFGGEKYTKGPKGWVDSKGKPADENTAKILDQAASIASQSTPGTTGATSRTVGTSQSKTPSTPTSPTSAGAEIEAKPTEAEEQKAGLSFGGGVEKEIFAIKDLVLKLTKDSEQVKGQVGNISKVILVKRGFKSEIDEKGKVRYRSTKEGSKGQFAKEEDASASYSALSMERSKKERELEAKTEKERSGALDKAISADEDPQLKIVKTLEAILKSLGEDDQGKTVHEKLDDKSGGGGGLLDTISDIASLFGRGGKAGRFGKIGRRLGAMKRLGTMKLGGGLKSLSKVGGNIATAGKSALGIGSSVGAPIAENIAAGSKAAAEVVETGAKAATTGAEAAETGLKAATTAEKVGESTLKAAGTASKTLKAAKGVLGFMKKIPGLSLIAAGATMLVEMKDAIDSHEKGEINDQQLHTTMAGVVGGALGGAGGSALLTAMGASVGSIVPGFGTAIGGILGGVGGFFAGEKIGRYAFEKIWGFFEDGGSPPAEALKKPEEQKSAAPEAPAVSPTTVAPPTPPSGPTQAAIHTEPLDAGAPPPSAAPSAESAGPKFKTPAPPPPPAMPAMTAPTASAAAPAASGAAAPAGGPAPALDKVTTKQSASVDTKGLNSGFEDRLAKMGAAFQEVTGKKLMLTSGFRSEDNQLQLWNAKFSQIQSANPNADVSSLVKLTRKWVALPVALGGKGSNHARGIAVDINSKGSAGIEAIDGMEYNGQKVTTDSFLAQFGLQRPLNYEPWHVQPLGALPTPDNPDKSAKAPLVAGADGKPVNLETGKPTDVKTPPPASAVASSGAPPIAPITSGSPTPATPAVASAAPSGGPAGAPKAPGALASAGSQPPPPGGAATPPQAPAAPAAPAAPGSPAAPALAAASPMAGVGLIASIKTDTSTILESIQALQSNLGGSLSSASNEMQDNQMIAQNQPPAEPVVINNTTSAGAPPAPKQQLPQAGTRGEESSFMRALAKDFSHPTAFTTVSMV